MKERFAEIYPPKDILRKNDSEAFRILELEERRQREGIELIASENYVSPTVLEAMSTAFTNKYAEGVPGKRYYGGNQFIDEIEQLAIDRAKKLFGAEHINVQPHSGNPANMCVYFALLEPGDTVLGLSLDHGGHLSHGLPINFSGKWYKFIGYKTGKEDGFIDMNEVRKLARKTRPKMILAGFSAYSRNMDWKQFKEIADEVGAITMADIAHIAGLIAGKQIENPVPIFDVVTTTTHKTLRGPRGAIIMCKEKYAKSIDRAVFPGIQGGPHEHTIAAKAVAFKEASAEEFQSYTKKIIQNAQALAKALVERGFRIVSGDTDNHLMLVDLMPKNLTGNVAEKALEKAGIYVNKNLIPYDPQKPMVTSGIRLGTPAITTRGMNTSDMEQIANFIDRVLQNISDDAKIKEIAKDVKEFATSFPIFTWS
ncbi:serine hydroxymethyltransferase [Patescibacteria group bacterium]|nr:serine hydroxymethyltransferase [Patescibacteria group bacterium]MBU4481254.1 serine hydroxymethyltransferase [Patescibacteria group bacterium]